MLTIALAQLEIHAGNPRYNTKAMKKQIAQAKQAGCDVIIFPELAMFGISLILSTTAFVLVKKFKPHPMALLLFTAMLLKKKLVSISMAGCVNTMLCLLPKTANSLHHRTHHTHFISKPYFPIIANSATFAILHP